jgi:hypothetical protein
VQVEPRGRRQAREPAENPREVGEIVEADREGDLRDGAWRCREQRLGLLDPAALQIGLDQRDRRLRGTSPGPGERASVIGHLPLRR